MRTPFWKGLIVLCVVSSLMSARASAQSVPDVTELLLPGGPAPLPPRSATTAVGGNEIQMVVRLTDAPLAKAQGRHAKQVGRALDASQQNEYLSRLSRKQGDVLAMINNLGGVEVARLSKALNALIITISPSQAASVAALPGVLSVRPLRDYKLDLSQTVPYIGASAVQGAGVTGAGVRVAVLDSGIDYTHAFFGGAGTAAAYLAAYGGSTADAKNKALDGLFPTAKVIGGYDFVGEVWPNGALAPDPDPIDCGPSAIVAPCSGGHGTHVADIIAGNDGAAHKGVAPDALLYAVKVCSAVSTSCSGVALLQGLEFALDPNGDGDISDAVDVVNMSLGSAYGQIEDDLTEAVSIASQFGVVVVAAAGNDADRPYIVSSPSIAPEAISVAQTQVPSAAEFQLTVVSPSSIAGNYLATFQPWSAPLTNLIQGPVQYGNGAGGNLNGCAAFPASSLAGKIVLIDRGVCTFSDKVRNVAGGGGLVGVIGLVAPGDPFEGGFGGGPAITIPGFMVTQATSNVIKAQLGVGVVAKFDPNATIPLVQSVVSTSARGPSYSFNSIKPDIGAPGASVSAEAGTGTGQTAFGGTSGATPMISGSAALLIQAFPWSTPLEVKARLMNTAETAIFNDPAKQPGVLAPITRIGGGEVRVNRAFSGRTAAWDDDEGTPSLSFGYRAIDDPKTITKTVEVHNYGNTSRTYAIASSFRYANDAASGAVVIDTPASVHVRAHDSSKFKVKLRIDPSKLPVWTLNGGSAGGDGSRLQGVEFDGYISLSSAPESIHLPFQVLPHRSAVVKPSHKHVQLHDGTGDLTLKNTDGAVNGRVEVFALLGKNPRIPDDELPEPGDNFAVIDLRYVGARLATSASGPLVQFGISTSGKRSHPNYPAEFDVYVDADRDGTPDFVVFNLENGGFAATGQNVVAVYNLATNSAAIYFFTDADLDSGNVILTAPLAALGLTAGSQFDFSVYAFDNYFTGANTDAIENMTFTAGIPRFVGSGIPSTGVPAGGVSTLVIDEVPGGDVASPSQTGLLLLKRDSKNEADVIRVHAHH